MPKTVQTYYESDASLSTACILSNIDLVSSHHGMDWCWTGSLFLNWIWIRSPICQLKLDWFQKTWNGTGLVWENLNWNWIGFGQAELELDWLLIFSFLSFLFFPSFLLPFLNFCCFPTHINAMWLHRYGPTTWAPPFKIRLYSYMHLQSARAK